MEINLTINGNRNLPLEVSPEVAARLNDPNAEFRIILVASPTGEERKFGTEGELIRKLKVVFVEGVILR
jgi:hypothetical protein